MAEEVQKLFITPDSLRRDAVAVARQLYDAGYQPNRIIGLWRGGSPIGLYVHEALKVLGVRADYIPVITRGYKDGADKPRARVAVQGLDSLAGVTRKDDNVLVVDDVWDSGRSIDQFFLMFEGATGDQFPDNIRVATVYYKPERNKSKRKPDHFIHKTDQWLVFPHELGDCTQEEIATHYGSDIAALLRK
ncbi:hypoxanthine phosphoribosyltransferase [Candidatus Woesearchaeota archaeon]|nr:hypoxanthine phosphoribosyltransferase [Candidatus Woesearchaeota archaeon]